MLFTENNVTYEYEIFSARRTDITDPAYHLDFNVPGTFGIFLEQNGAPMGSEQIITLSTCIGANNDRRMIVQGSLKRTVPVTTEYNDEGGWRIIRPN